MRKQSDKPRSWDTSAYSTRQLLWTLQRCQCAWKIEKSEETFLGWETWQRNAMYNPGLDPGSEK